MAARPLRLKGFDYRGCHRYFLTFCTADRHRAFRSAEVVDRAVCEIRRACCDANFALLAYCLMPDHAHLLVEGKSEQANLKQFAKLVRQRTAIAYTQMSGQRLWQSGFYERVLRDEEATPDIVRYIVGNPVRAGLTGSVADYPFSGSDACDVRVIL
jgi:REP element-mobilizing transposase RayT